MLQEDWVLCRVFHKSKGSENSTRLSPPMMFETSSHALSLTDQTSMPCGNYQQISSLSTTPNTTLQSHGQSLLNLLQYNSQEKNNNNDNNNPYSNEVSSKGDDEFDTFLWDMNMEDQNSLGDHHHVHGVATSNLEDIRFDQMDNNSMVFL